MSTPKNILVATDFDELGQWAVQVAFDLGSKLGSKVHLIHVFALQGRPELAALAMQAMRDAELLARGKLSTVADEYRSTGCLGEVIVRNGDPASMILLGAEEVSAELIALGTRGRKGLGRLFLGSTAESVLRQATCPVLVAKQPRPAPRPAR